MYKKTVTRSDNSVALSNTCDAMQYKIDDTERWESKEYSYLDKGSCFIDVFVIWT